jgi:ABC-2 type transport system permease protein
MSAPSSASPSRRTEPARGRIHNIGYRKYDGARLGRAYATRALFTQSLRGAYGLGRSAKSKVLPMILFGVMCLPAGIIVAVAVATDMDKLPLPYTSYVVYLQAVIAIFLAGQAPVAVSRDLRFKTTPLYFSRPIERLDYVVAKFAATSAALFALTAAPLVVLYAGALLAKLSFTTQTKDFALALFGALLLSLLFTGLGLVVAALTPRRGFGVAAVIALFTIPYGAVSAVQGIAHDQGNDAVSGWLGLFSPITLIDGAQSWMFGIDPAGQPAGPPNAFAGLLFVLVILGATAGCFGLLMARYRKVGLS